MIVCYFDTWPNDRKSIRSAKICATYPVGSQTSETSIVRTSRGDIAA